VRIGLFGGTFDPPHAGHLALARAAVKELRLDRLYVVPAGNPPLKSVKPLTSARRRLALARRAFGGLPKTIVTPWEARRPGTSFTHKTLDAFRRRHPSAEWFLIVGGDSWRNFTRWRRWRDILKVARLAVGTRPGVPLVGASPAVRKATIFLKARMPRVSSTEIRSQSARR
jgi:nicotinate-nucleotide adenylyltransferase